MRIQQVALLCGILLLIGAPHPAVAAGAPAAAPADAAQQVVLPVTVRDKKGDLVTDLQKSDLTLTQDGRPQTIASLTRQSDEPFRIGLIMDTSHSMNGAQGAAIKAAESFLDQVLPADSKNQVFLIHFDREVELLQDFTSDKSELYQQLDQLGPTRAKQSNDEGPETNDTPSLEGGRHNANQLYDAIYLACDELMKNKPGRRILVVFSNGADRGSKETMNDAVDAADRSGVDVYTIFLKGSEDRSLGSGLGGNRRGGWGGGGGGYPGGGGGYPGGGGGYPGGGGGRRQPEPKAGNGQDGKKIMQELAQRTGGHAYEAKHSGDLAAIYKLIDDEINGQYLLTYTPD
ncbi:MAG: VWA domain-containing protein, partial [Bryobacteraceae bacterium]